MNWLKSFWTSIPRKLKYVGLTLAAHALAAKFPGLGITPELVDLLLGGGLVGGHIATDVSNNLGAALTKFAEKKLSERPG